MARSERAAFGIVILGIALAGLSSAAQSPPAACVKRGDQFIATFGPAPNSKALRASRLEMEEQVRLAFYSMDRQRVEMAAGLQKPEDSLRSIAGYEQTIRNYLHDRSNEALVVASSGRAADIPQISRSLIAPMSIARQDGLLGREAVAQDAQNKVVAILKAFSARFAETCEQQDFPVEMAVALDRQNYLMGTGISLEHCMNRMVTADFDDRGIHYHFERCTLDGTGEWTVKLTGLASGSGSGLFVEKPSFGGMWFVERARIEQHNVHISLMGQVELKTKVIEEQVSPSSAPQDAGPHAKPNSCVPAPVVGPPVTQKRQVLSLRSTTTHTGRFYTSDLTKWVEVELKHSGKACPRR